MPSIKEMFEEKGILSKAMAEFEFRQPQRDMVEAIEAAVAAGSHLLVEAGTGVGKSLAYLLPFIQWAVEGKKKVVISTYSRALQFQLLEKDIPFLRKALKLKFRSALCVGGQNYICRRRLLRTREHDLFDSLEESRQITAIAEWERSSSQGLKQELDFEPLSSLWGKICREGDLCLGRKCPHRDDCYYMRARIIQNRAHILVVNHHLFFAHLASGENVLPPFDAVVFDEAHNLEETAAAYLGAEVASTQVKYLADSLYNPRSRKGLLGRIGSAAEGECVTARHSVERMCLAGELLFDEMSGKCGGRKSPLRMKEPWEIMNVLRDPMTDLMKELESLNRKIENDEDRLEVAAFLKRIRTVRENLDVIMEQQKEEHVYWLEVQRRHAGNRVSLNMAPVDIAASLRELVFEQIAPVVMTSATLSTDGNFDYIKERLGIPGAESRLLGSPFDYRTAAILYMARDLPDPGRATEAFEEESITRIIELLEVTGGSTFVLFTSNRYMERAYENIKPLLKGFTLMRQGEKPHSMLVEDFKRGRHAVLFGTNSFWQGIDIPGRALESVIITKLPFAVPDDPVTEARIDYLKSKEIDPFSHFQIPQAVIWLKQGFGRLIRTREDRGMVAILDPRIVTRVYGKRFLRSLPECRVTTSLRDVEAFYQDLAASRED